VTHVATSPRFKENAKAALADPELQNALKFVEVNFIARRREVSDRLPEFDALRDADVCCGFGGTFCVKYPDISNAIVEKKAANAAASGADLLLAGDLGCLMNMAGKLQRDGHAIEVRHVAEVLAGMARGPAIGMPLPEPVRSEPGRSS